MKHFLILLACLCAFATSLHAQWVTETYTLKPGWNGIWIPLNLDHAASMDSILPPEVTRVHMWTNSKAGVIAPNPFGDTRPVSLHWEKWTRGNPAETTFSQMLPNSAYLVEVNGTTPITWALKGKPEAPYYAWSSDGANLIGFPLRTDGAVASRLVSRVFELDSVLLDPGTTEAFHYNGGPMFDANGATANPIQIPASGAFPLNRFQAYWIKAKSYTDYYGPVNVNLGSSTGGMSYGTNSSSIAVRIRSAVKTSIGNITVTIAPVPSETPPTGQSAIVASVPLRLRGTLDLATGLHGSREVTATAPVTLTLAPGEEKELIFALDRTRVIGSETTLYASTLRITDSLGVSDIRIPVTARPTPKQGLWVGNAVVNRVDQIEPIAFSGSISNNPATGTPVAGDTLVVTKAERGTLIADTPISGQYVREGTRIISQISQAAGKPPGKEGTYRVSIVQRVSNPDNRTNLVMYRIVPAGSPDPMAIKLILHSSNDGTVRLLQRAIGGTVNNISAVGLDETAFLGASGGKPVFRVSSAHFPAKLNEPNQPGSGSLPVGPLSFTVTLAHDAPSHPFVHVYHPDHDNMDERFEQPLPKGRESNTITRAIVFNFVPNNPNGFDPQWGGTRLGGTYRETITGLRSIPIVCSGAFVIDRVADAVQFLPNP